VPQNDLWEDILTLPGRQFLCLAAGAAALAAVSRYQRKRIACGRIDSPELV
jgi:hypothetical protein